MSAAMLEQHVPPQRRASDADLLTDRLDIGALKSELGARAVIARTMGRNANTALAARAFHDLATALEAEIATLSAVIAALKALHDALPSEQRRTAAPRGQRDRAPAAARAQRATQRGT